jgi:hypothetical protein
MKSAPSWIGLATGFRGFKSPSWRRIRRIRTIGWHDVACVHGVLVFDEAETIHNLDFGNLSGAMGGKEGLNIGLGSIARKVPQVEPGGRDLSHDGGGSGVGGTKEQGKARQGKAEQSQSSKGGTIRSKGQTRMEVGGRAQSLVCSFVASRSKKWRGGAF